MTKEIPLTHGKVAIVDDRDYEWLMQRKWGAAFTNGENQPAYAQCASVRKAKLMHRAIVERYQEIPRGMVVDHINGDTLDNRLSNLRIATHAENLVNRKPRSDSKSGFRGVTWIKSMQAWGVMFYFNNNTVGASSKYYGTYESPVIAAVFANDIIRQRDGAFARLNDIPPSVELLARQVPVKRGRKRTKAEIEAQRAHAAMVDAAYTDWLAEAPPTASANAAANAA